MEGASGRSLGVILLLLLVWVGVYWWWPAAPAVSFADPTPMIELAPPVIRPPERPSPRPELTTQDVRPAAVTPPPPADTVPGVIPPAFVEHTLKGGQTLEDVSREHYGTTQHAPAIARANPLMSPINLKAGRVIRVPVDPTNIQGKPATGEGNASAAAAVPQEYVVLKGDSLAKIARRVYGEDGLAAVIFEANKDTLSSPDRIKVGQKLRIPPKPEK